MYVIGAGHAGAADLVAELGADQFVDVDREPLEQVVRPVNLVLDLVGSEALVQSREIVASGGTVVSLVENKPMARERDDVRGIFFIVEARSSELTELARRIDARELRPVIGQVVSLAQRQRAFEAKRAHGLKGKSVLQVRS